MYRIQYRDIPSGRLINVVDSGTTNWWICTLSLSNDDRSQLSYPTYKSQAEVARHLFNVGLDPDFRKLAGYDGEHIVYFLSKKLANRVTDFDTAYEEATLMESPPLTEIDELSALCDITKLRSSLADARRWVDEEIAFAKEWLAKGNHAKAKEAISRVIGSLSIYDKNDAIRHLSQGIERKIYSPFDGMSEESRSSLRGYVSAKIAELKRGYKPLL